MNFNEVKELVSMIDSSSLKSFELTLDNCNIKMNKTGNAFSNNSVQSETINVGTPVVPAPAVSAHVQTEEAPAAPATKTEDLSGNIVKAPLVGTFYISSGPGKEAFAPVGKKVKKGDVLCIIEAMKIMNEVVSDFDGEVKEILAENEQLVEYGQPLFRIG